MQQINYPRKYVPANDHSSIIHVHKSHELKWFHIMTSNIWYMVRPKRPENIPHQISFIDQQLEVQSQHMLYMYQRVIYIVNKILKKSWKVQIRILQDLQMWSVRQQLSSFDTCWKDRWQFRKRSRHLHNYYYYVCNLFFRIFMQNPYKSKKQTNVRPKSCATMQHL